MQKALQQVRAGKLTALAMTGPQRSHHLPETPTFAELGHPEFTTTVWFGLLVKAGTSPEAASGLLNAARAVHKDPEVRARLQAMGFDVSGQEGRELAGAIKAQTDRWAKIVKATGFKAD
jgi:tripartite-type tricarboxylate transporter receptor subunit TctC